MEPIVYGWQTYGVCDRLTAMLLLYSIAQKTGRKALWHWVANHNCNSPFHRLFETDGIEVSEDTFSSYDRNNANAIVDAVASLYLLRNTHGIIGSSVSGYSICAGWDCGFINLPPDRCYNFSWSGDTLAFKPPRLLNFDRHRRQPITQHERNNPI